MSVFLHISILIATSVMIWRIWLRLRYFLHMFQLEGYKVNEFSQWLKSSRSLFPTLSHKVGILLSIAILALSFTTASLWPIASLLLLWVPVFLFTARYGSEGQKKPLVNTARMKRLWWLTASFIALDVLITLLALALLGYFQFYFIPILLLTVDWAMPQLVKATGRIMKPFEKNIHEGFKSQARSKLNSLSDLQSVGITGSFGKTSVKFILQEMLSQRLSVLATPSSFNTPMGISKVVNNDLNANHQVFIAEMGARYEGDIAELVELVHPSIGVVTSVGPAHLETMGPIENIAKVKGELIRGLPDSGLAVLNMDNDHVAAMANACKASVTFVSTKNPNADFFAEKIGYDSNGTRFDVVDSRNKLRHSFQCQLLGEHNVINILFGVAVASHFGIGLRQLSHAVSRLEAIPHRLALRKQGGLTIIDDAFNSNPIGSKNALDILASFPEGTKFIITPGMVELGEKQEYYNKAFGIHMAKKADVVILVGKKQTKPIQDGLAEAGFDASNLHVVSSLFEAQDLLATLSATGDVVLYENDLPDQYNEGG